MFALDELLIAPFPYFGGKSQVADMVWQALGDVAHYIEPFFGSGAVLLKRPNFDPVKHTETINDKDAYVANVWRALKLDPDKTAYYADWPVNHADLIARRKRLLEAKEFLFEKIVEDEDFFDAKIAGYWIWAASCWIGDGLTTNFRTGIPFIGHSGKWIHKKAIRDVTGGANKRIYDWFKALSTRLRYVRVVCGDWSRVCGGSWHDEIGIVGFFFDPPYGVSDRKKVYDVDSKEVAKDVLAFCKKWGNKETYRIVVAGYEEHEELLKFGWTKQSWVANGGYSKSENKNRFRETLYFSPHCLKSTLF